MPDLDIGRLVGYVELDDSGVAQGVQGAKDKISDLGRSGAGLAKATGIGLGLALGAGLAGAVSADAAGAKLTAQLDLTAGESERLGRVAGNLYSGAYGESLEEVNEALRNVVLNVAGMADANEADLERIGGKVLNVATTFDQDLGGVTRAVGTMLRNGLAKDADEALDVLTRGFQSGVNVADDLLDTFSEYSTQFRKLGLDGTEATGLLRQGLEGGARDADTVADALKELSIRAIDGSEATARGFDTLGLSGSELGRQFAAGGKSAREALDTTLDRLRAIDDPSARAAAAVDLFGTKAEDLGAALYDLDLDTAADGMGNVEGAAQRVGDALGGTAAAQFTTLTRSAERFAVELASGALPVLSEVGGAALDVLTPALRVVGDVVGGVAEAFGELPGPVQSTAVVLAGLVAFRGPITDLGGSFRKLATDALEWSAYGAVRAIDGVTGLGGAATGAGGKLKGLATGGVGALAGALGGPLGLAIAGASIAIPVLSGLFDDNAADAAAAARANSDLAQALRDSNGAMTEGVRAAAAKEAEDKGLLKTAEAAGVSLATVTDAVLGNKDAYDEVTAALAAYQAENTVTTASENGPISVMNGQAEAAQTARGALDELAPTVAETAAEQARLTEATETTTGATEDTAEASALAEEAAARQAEAYDALKDALDRYLGVNIDAAEAQLNVYDGLAELVAQTEEQGTTLDRTTQAGRDNERAILDQITAVGDLASATYRQTGSSAKAKEAFDRERDALRDKLYALGYNKQAVDTLIATYGRIPDEVWTDVQVDTSGADARLRAWLAKDRHAVVYVDEKLGTVVANRGGMGGRITEKADGGLLEFFADGGLRPLTPMSGARSARVPADTWRVIGDRAVGDEFYLLDDNQPSTLALGAEWARRRGMSLVPVARYADGGTFPAGAAATATPAATAVLDHDRGPLVQFSGPVSLHDPRDAQELADELDWRRRSRGRRR